MAVIGSVIVTFGADMSRFTRPVQRAGESIAAFADRCQAAQKRVENTRLERWADRLERRMRTPDQRYMQFATNLDRAFRKGLITHELHSRALTQAAQDFAAATQGANKFTGGIGKMMTALSRATGIRLPVLAALGKGGAVVGAIWVAAKLTEYLGDVVMKLEEVRLAGGTWRDMYAEITRGLPILGEFQRGLENIYKVSLGAVEAEAATKWFDTVNVFMRDVERRAALVRATPERRGELQRRFEVEDLQRRAQELIGQASTLELDTGRLQQIDRFLRDILMGSPEQAAAVKERGAVKMVQDLQEKLLSLGRTEAEVYLARMAREGATTHEQKYARLLWDRVEAFEAQTKAADEAEKRQKEVVRAWEEWGRRGEELAKSLRTPIEELTDSLADYQRMLETGAITWGTFDRAAAAAMKRAEGALGLLSRRPWNLAPLAEAGTAEEYRLRALSVARDEARPEIRELKEIKAVLHQIREETRAMTATERAKLINAGVGPI